MVRPGKSLQLAQPGPDVAARLEALPNARPPHRTRAALRQLTRADFAIERLRRQPNGGSRGRIAGEPAEPTP
jgi:hypothetical protein